MSNYIEVTPADIAKFKADWLENAQYLLRHSSTTLREDEAIKCDSICRQLIEKGESQISSKQYWMLTLYWLKIWNKLKNSVEKVR